MKIKLLSVGANMKLSKNVAVFNLPQGKTCPGATELCRKICYAAKAERMYPQAAAMRARNLRETKEASFVVEMIEELDYLIRQRNLKYVRVHESGDFYNQTYLDKWIEIAREEPEITFLAYTKSFNLNFDKYPDNMKIYASTDSTSEKLRGTGPFAHIVQKGEQIPKGYVTCQPAHDKHYCGADCTTCFQGKSNVYFPQH